MDRNTSSFALEFYRLPDGSSPVEDFLDSLNDELAAKAVAGLKILQQRGYTLREPHSKPVGNGIFELRIQFANDIARIFYFFVVNNTIVLTNGFIKKRRKTPPAELDRAKKYKADYERRHYGRS